MQPQKIKIDGKRKHIGLRVMVDGRELYLPWTNFKIMAILAMYRYVGINAGWVERGILYEPHEQTARNIYRTKIIIADRRSDLENWEFTENDGACFYRLLIDPNAISIDWQRLRGLNDHDLETAIRAVT